jgi:DNA-binding IclR family transcriptional regulator
MSENELEKYLMNNPLKRRTPKTIINIKTLKNQLVKIRKEGIAFDDEEYAMGVFGIASDIRDSTGEVVGSAGILAPSARRSRDEMLKLAPILKEYSYNISKQLGYKDNNQNNNFQKSY